MREVRGIGLSLVAALLIACSSDKINGPPIGVSHAVAMFACGPADGPAVVIYLTPEEWKPELLVPPYVGIYIAQSVDVLPGQTWDFANAKVDGTAWLQSAEDTHLSATSGYLTVTSVDADRTVTGKVDLTFPNAVRTRGEFQAKWTATNVICN